MDSQNKPKPNEPCPECKKDGDEKGYIVKKDCPHCLGTGYKRQDKSFMEMLRNDFQ